MKGPLYGAVVVDDEYEDRETPSPEMRQRIKQSLAALRHEKTRRWEYLKIARRARDHRKAGRPVRTRAPLLLSHAEFRLLFALVEYADADLRHSYPSVNKLAALEGWKPRTVQMGLQALCEKGWLIREDLYGKLGTKINQFCVPEGAISRTAERWEGPRS